MVLDSRHALFNWKDFSFWMILAVLVLVTAIYETTRVRKRTLTPSRVTLRQRTDIWDYKLREYSLLMCILWAYWSCQSWAEFETLIDAASRPTFREMMIVWARYCWFVYVLCCGGGRVEKPQKAEAPRQPGRHFTSGLRAATVAIGALCLLILPSIATRLFPDSNCDSAPPW